jgi:hypothetical protein
VRDALHMVCMHCGREVYRQRLYCTVLGCSQERDSPALVLARACQCISVLHGRPACKIHRPTICSCQSYGCTLPLLLYLPASDNGCHTSASGKQTLPIWLAANVTMHINYGQLQLCLQLVYFSHACCHSGGDREQGRVVLSRIDLLCGTYELHPTSEGHPEPLHPNLWCVEHPAQPDKQLTCRQGWELAQGAQEPGCDNGRAQTWHGTHVSTALY